MFADSSIVTDDRRSGALRSGAAHSGMRGLGGACCSGCAGSGGAGLGDISTIAATITQSKAVDALFLISLTVGAIAGAISIYDHLKKKRRHRPRRTAKTMTIPVQTMRDLVYGED